MTVLSDILNVDVKEVEVFPIVATAVVCVGALIFVKKNKQQFPDANRSINVYTLIFVYLVLLALVWIIVEAVRGIPSPPLQLLALIQMLLIGTQCTHFLFDTLFQSYNAHMMLFSTPLAYLFVAVVYGVNQYTTIFRNIEYINVLFRGIKIPSKHTMLIPLVLVYLLIECLLSLVRAIKLYRDRNDPEVLHTLCGGGPAYSAQKRSLTKECVRSIRYDHTTYDLFMKMLIVLLYTCYHFQTAARE